MGARQRLAVSIVSLVSTMRGFAFAVTEDPRRLVAFGLRRVPSASRSALAAMRPIIERARPLFLAFDTKSSSQKSHRGRQFDKAVRAAIDTHGFMLLEVRREQLTALCLSQRKRKWDIA